MAKDGIIEVEGVVVETLPNTKFIVEIQGGHRLTSYILSLIHISEPTRH